MYIVSIYNPKLFLKKYLLVIYVFTMNRDVQFLMRLSKAEKDGFKMAAEIAGVGLSAWARQRLRSAATGELERAGMRAPFLKPIPINAPSDES